jgi:hypothetical protein
MLAPEPGHCRTSLTDQSEHLAPFNLRPVGRAIPARARHRIAA